MHRTVVRQFLAVILSLGAPAAFSYTMGPATLVSGLAWAFSTAAPGLSDCTEMHLDAIGDPERSPIFAVHGFLECAGGVVATSGTAIMGKDGSLGLSVRIGVNAVMICGGLRGFSGTCQLSSLAAQPFGPVRLTYR